MQQPEFEREKARLHFLKNVELVYNHRAKGSCSSPVKYTAIV
jgi:hypothetical protein